jgi:16S rRNA (cytidine1402-2'-O)-methyltransferase
LYLCATPIGNLEDITLRVLRILREADLIAAEDTRHTLKLLNHFGIKTALTSYHKFSGDTKAEHLIRLLAEGKSIALVTDAGTPSISDPGEGLVRRCVEEGIPVTTLPGPCACIAALTLSGMGSARFCFEGFLPTPKRERAQTLDALRCEERTAVLYEAPHRLGKTMQELAASLGARRVAVCRELTKIHEAVFRGTLPEAAAYYGGQDVKGECVIVLEGVTRAAMEEEKRKAWETLTVEEHLAMYLAKGMARKEALKLVAQDRGVSKRDIYNALI